MKGKTEKIVLYIVLGVIALTIINGLLTPRGYGMMGMMGSGFGVGSMMLFGWLFGLLLLVALILVIIWFWQQIEASDRRKRT